MFCEPRQWQGLAGGLTQSGSQDTTRYITNLPIRSASLLDTIMAVRGPKSNQISDLNRFPGEQSTSICPNSSKARALMFRESKTVLLYRESLHPKPGIGRLMQEIFVFLFPCLNLSCVAKCLPPRLSSLSFIWNLNSLPCQPESLSLGNGNGKTLHSRRKSDTGRP